MLTRRPYFCWIKSTWREVYWVNLGRSSQENFYCLPYDYRLVLLPSVAARLYHQKPGSGKLNLIGACLYGCTFVDCANRQQKYRRFSGPYVKPSFLTSYPRINMTFSKHFSIATVRECIGTTLSSTEKMPQKHLSMNDVPSSGSTTRLLNICNHAQGWRSYKHTEREMKHPT